MRRQTCFIAVRLAGCRIGPGSRSGARPVVRGWVTTVATAAVISGVAGPAPADPVASDIVTVETGRLRGVTATDHRMFAGIPYAAPPVGELRWRPPAPAASWSGVRDAARAGPSCPQDTGVFGTLGANPTKSEDCLYLNVSTPRTPPADARPLPVLVWIHGGSLTTGSGDIYGPGPLIAQGDGDIVVVTLNYRLGALGFLAASALDDGSGPGNYGYLDQQAALRWVRRNIAAFGGDPEQVTLAGESAGAASVCTQLAAPSSRGLFRAAIRQSGLCTSGASVAKAKADGDAYAERLGCAGPETAACLRGLPVETLVDDAVITTVFGGEFLPTSPQAALRAGTLTAVPTFVGANNDEMALWVYLEYGVPLGKPLIAAEYRDALAAAMPDLTPEQIDEIEQAYPAAAYPQPALALSRAWTDRTLTALTVEYAALGPRNPTYTYSFDDPAPLAPPNIFPLGAYHASELPSLWSLRDLGWLYGAVMSPDQQRLATEMRRYWTRFAIDGRPSPAGLEPIPAYDPAAPLVMSLRPTGNRLTDSYAADHRADFWSDLLPR
ncbi:carboxylesterase family protein [Nocardia sp. NBC_00565]|uniref:carboxylesterase/lipase family protein n=1 Tax=Nocardia sp. NBC_00565 TaxID=2975993 RepID=UPI002E80C067|nr:carboxylesterase family protein [Nocardia sp. NBC_00565]WUC07407.1 carboxylesterase family protein [Nocardia sp. NBC_00565]